MTRRLVALLCILCAALVALPAAAPAKTKVKKPKVTLVSPMRLEVGDLLVIRGRNFNKKARKNTVVFRAGGRSVLVKPIRATTKKLVVKVPASVVKLFSTRSGDPVSTRFQLQVLTNKKRTATPRRLSPVIVPEPVKKKAAPVPQKKTTGGATPAPAAPAGPPPPCGTGSDFDGDLLSNALEATLHTNACKKDTDGDGVEDGFEYKSAVDLNDDEFQEPNTSLPYPGDKPYPNPLDGTDGNVDYDGDSLTSIEEQALWNLTIANGATRTLDPLTYSAGEKYSMLTRGSDGRRVPTLAAAGYTKQTDFLGWATTNGYRNVMLENRGWTNAAGATLTPGLVSYGLLDFNRDGVEDPPPPNDPAGAEFYFRSETEYYDFDNDTFLSDNERDEDGDGLTNYDETHGRMTPGYWASCYPLEHPFRIAYAGTSPTKVDTDGDGVRDGADDQDHDDIPNLAELSRNASSGLYDGQGGCKPAESLPTPPATNHPDVFGRVNPFNPCLPATFSRTCDEHPAFEDSGAPFDESPNWYSLN